MHTPNICALCGIRTHDPGFRASEDSTCLRWLGCRDRLFYLGRACIFFLSITEVMCTSMAQILIAVLKELTKHLFSLIRLLGGGGQLGPLGTAVTDWPIVACPG
jgi:hypothetical protein